MELKNFSQEVNEQLFGKGSRQVSMGEFIDMSVSAHKSRSDEQNVIRETAAGNKIVIKPRRVRFNGIELSQEQFRALVDIPIEELSPVGFRNLLGAMSIYAPVMFKDKKIFSRTEEFAKSEIGRRALEYQRQQERRPLKAAESKSSVFLLKQHYVHKPPLRRGLYFFTANAPAGTDYFFDDTETILKKNEKKKKLNELLDRYGSIENIEKNTIGVDGYDYMFADTDNLINEVLEERSLRQVSRLAKQEEKSSEYDKIRKEDELENISRYIPSEGFNDVYHSKLDEDGRVIYLGTEQHEGGYSDRENDLGKKTNYSITQFSLDEYNNLWNSYLKKGKNFPKDVRQLKPIQAKQILDEMYFQRYGIDKIKNPIITRNVFDEEMNQGTNAGKDIAELVNKVKGTNFPLNKVINWQ